MYKGVIFDFNRTLYNPDNNQLEPGSLYVLRALKEANLPMCLLSKKSKEDRETQIQELGIERYFLDIQVIEGSKKEEHFVRCKQAMNLSASEILVIGDRIKEEIRVGNSCGMATAWYRCGKFAQELPQQDIEEPKYIITNLEQVLKLIFDEKKN